MIVILSDIHSNYKALECINNYISEYNISKIFCAGDIVGYYTRPNETINWFRERNVISVLGNHDKAMFDNSILKTFNIYAKQACIWNRRKIENFNLEYLKNLPEEYRIEVCGRSIYIVHGSPINHLGDYVYGDYIDNDFILKYFKNIPDIIIMGQTHIPYIKQIRGTVIINPGSVGQPRDGDYRTCFAMVDTNLSNVEIIRLNYDKTEILKETREELSEYLAQRLMQGI